MPTRAKAHHSTTRPPPPSAQDRETAAERGYDHRWRRARLAWLREHPICVECEKEGLTVAATVVDHITPHRGDEVRFWDSAGNWQSLCSHHHAVKPGEGRFGWKG